MAVSILTADRLRELLDYDPSTGEFRWRVRVSPRGLGRVGEIAGWINSHGYRAISIDNREYKAHRLAVLYMTGAWPPREVDHVKTGREGKSDNPIGNLRPANRSQNNANRGPQVNNKSGFKGVCWHKRDCAWRAQIKFGGKVIVLGNYPDARDAAIAHDIAERILQGPFAHPNFSPDEGWVLLPVPALDLINFALFGDRYRVRHPPIVALNKHGLRGVCWSNRNRKWWSHIRINGKRRHLGTFDTPEAAHAAYVAAAEKRDSARKVANK